MKKTLVFTAVIAIVAVILLAFKQSDSNTAGMAALTDNTTSFPNPSAALASQQALGKYLAKMEALYRKQGQQIEALHQRVTTLSSQIDGLQRPQKRESLPRLAQNRTNAPVKRAPVAERFDSGSLATTETSGIDIEELIYENLPINSEAPLTDCKGSLCKVYTFSGDPEAANNDFVSNLSKNLRGNVNVYFVDEAGQQVIYIESVE